MGKKILKLLLYLMAVVGVLIWLDSTEGLTEEGALIIFGIALLMYFVMKLIGFLTKRHRIRRERARKARRKRELREVNNHRGKQETGRKAENICVGCGTMERKCFGKRVAEREKSDNIRCCDSGSTGKLPETAKNT